MATDTTKVVTATATPRLNVDQQIQRFYDRAFDWIMSVGPRLIFAFIVLMLGLWVIKVVNKRVTKRLDQRNIHSTLRPFMQGMVFTALYVALFFLILGILGIKLTIFAAIIAAFGAAAGLALSGTLQNFASGILILLLKPFATGDNIVTQGFEGTVTSIQIFYTIITTFDNRTVVMPNSKLSNDVIVNITAQGTRRLDIDLKFPFAEDYNKVKDILEEAFESYPEVLKDKKIRIGVTDVNVDVYTVTSSLWINAHGFQDSKMVIYERIIKTLKDAGVSLGKS